MKASVIIPAHNEEDYLEATLEGFFRQSLRHELLVVSNGSTDRTVEVARDLGANVFELNQANVSAARNFGANQSRENILVFNDADTVPSNNYLMEVVNAVEFGADYGSARLLAEGAGLSTKLYNLITFYNGQFLKKPGGNMFVTRDAFERISGGFDTSMCIGEDTDFVWKLAARGFQHDFLERAFLTTSMRRYDQRGFIREGIRETLSYLKQERK